MLLLAAAALAAPPGGKDVMVYNYPSVDSCASWTDDRRGRRSQAMEGWVLGVLTGYNVYRAPTGNIAPSVTGTGMLGWIDQFCATNPLESVTTATFKLISVLEQRAR
jgi:hypothetical protein